MDRKSLYLFSKYLIELMPNYIEKIKIFQNEISIYCLPLNIEKIMLFLKMHINCKFSQLVDICGVDLLVNNKRFEIIYNLLSISFNFRLKIKVLLNEIEPVFSLNKIFNSSIWLEREVWDMFGIFFINHRDLRRILTDYGFDGYPFRKDFPQIGFVEIRYDDTQKHVLYEPVELAQAYRLFNFNSPWLQVK